MSDIPINDTGFERCMLWLANWLVPKLPGANEKYILNKDIEKARAELAQLRADLQAARTTIAEQARQLEAARTILQFIGKHDYPNGTLRNAASNWLAAQPAPAEPQPQKREGRP